VFRIGFAAEDSDLADKALEKMQRKGLQGIVANDISRKDTGFGSDHNAGVVFFADGSRHELDKMTKREMADRILIFSSDPGRISAEVPIALITRKDLPVNNLKEFIAYIKANESKMQFGSAGVGSGTHLPCVLFNQAIGANVTHVPYRGEGPVMQDLIGGRIDYMCATVQSGAAQAKEGAVKGIAVMSPKRVPIIPDLATTGEQGLPGVEASVWNAFFFPKGTPEPIVHKMNKAMSDTLDDPVIRKKLEELGLEIVAPERRSPDYLAKYLPEEIERWAKPIRQAGISAD